MRAAVCRAFGRPLVVEDVELRGPEPGEVSVRLAACGVCHSDVAYADGEWGGSLPAIYGHEAAGTVEDVGGDVPGVRPGDHVVVDLIRFCGRCNACARGQPALCENLLNLALTRNTPLSDASGGPIHQGLRTGALAERVTVHGSQVVPIPADVPLPSAALLACGVMTGVGAVLNTARLRIGSVAVVVGVGGVGLNAIQGAAIAGASTIVAVDVLDAKLTAARAFGATHAVNAGSEDALEAIGSLTDGKGADDVFVTAGSAAAVQQALSLVRRGGTVVIVGMPPRGVTVPFDPAAVADGSIRVLGSKVGDARPHLDIPMLVRLYRQKRLKLDELITSRHTLDDVNGAIDASRRPDGVRPVITL